MRPLLQWESNKYYIFWVCVCSLRYPTCNAHAQCCHLWPTPLYHIFPHYLTNSTIFGRGGGITEHKMCVWILSTIFSEIFLILLRTRRDIINVLKSSYKFPAILVISEWNLNSLNRFSKNTKTWNLLNVCPAEADFLRADRQTWWS